MSDRTTTPVRKEAQSEIAALASLLEYPAQDFEARLAHATQVRSGASAERRHSSPADSTAIGRDAATAALARFAAAMSALSSEQREELYTATFDVTPACVAYVSIHLFGEENFKRGAFMAAINARYEQASFHAGGELPDHLAVLLRFAAETDEAEQRELVEFCLLGPIGKMLTALTAENPYRALLEAVWEVLRAAYPGVKPAPSPLDLRQQHGGSCAAASAGCDCGAARDEGPRSSAPTSHEALSIH